MSLASDLRARSRAQELCVGIVWLVCAVILVTWTARFASHLPFQDDLLMAPFVDPARPLTWDMLWAQHNEHRIPLPKLVYVLLVGGFDDLRAGVWFTVTALLAFSLALLWALRRRAGSLQLTDALIPLALLTTANAENLLNSFQVCFTLPVLGAGALLIGSLALRPPWKLPALLAAALVPLLLALCGSMGIVQGAILALIPAAMAWSTLRERGTSSHTSSRASSRASSRIGAWLALTALAALVAYIALYLRGFERLPGFEAPATSRTLETSLQVLSTGFGAVSETFWPWLGLFALLAVAGAALALWRSRGGEHAGLSRALALQLAAGLALALAIGYGRGNDGPAAGFANRYVGLMAPTLIVIHLALRLCGRGLMARVLEGTLCLAVIAGFQANYQYGFLQGHARWRIEQRFDKQAAEGAGVRELAKSLWKGMYYDEAGCAELLEQWRVAGFLPRVRAAE